MTMSNIIYLTVLMESDVSRDLAKFFILLLKINIFSVTFFPVIYQYSQYVVLEM